MPTVFTNFLSQSHLIITPNAEFFFLFVVCYSARIRTLVESEKGDLPCQSGMRDCSPGKLAKRLFFPSISPFSSRLKTHSESLTLICTLEHIVRKWSKKLAFQIPAESDYSKGSVTSLTGESNLYCVQLSSVTRLLIMVIQEHTAISFQLYEPKECHWQVN